MRLIIIILLIFSGYFVPVFSQHYSQIPWNEENYPKYEKWIRDNAPADSAYVILDAAVKRLLSENKPYYAREFLTKLSSLFPKYSANIRQLVYNCDEIMMSTTPRLSTIFPFYEKLVQDSADTETGYIALQRRVDEYVNYFKMDSAIMVYKKFRPLFKKLGWKIDKTIEILSEKREGIRINNIGRGINTKAGEWDPNPTPDGKYLYFTGSNRAGGSGREDVFVSKFENGKWGEAINVGSKINGPNSETIDNISTDANVVTLSGDFEGTFGSFDIYTITRTADGWGPLEHLPYPINTKFYDDGLCVSSDGKVVIFTSDRPSNTGPFHPREHLYHGNTHGNVDIYVCFKTDSGWSAPVSLGPTINTPYAERSPYLHPDGRTLYFGSDGFPGLGRMDVYKTVRLREDSWTEWSTPVNLGPEINTIADDWGYKISVNGDSAFFAAFDRTLGYGKWDIFSVRLPKQARPDQVITVKGRVIDQNGKPLNTEIKWEDLSSGKNLGILHSNPQDGTYIIILPLGKNIGFYAQKEGYYPTSNNIDLRTRTEGGELIYNITLYSIDEMAEKKIKVRINNIFFDFDKYDLKPESYPELDRLADILKNNTSLYIKIEGHTDKTGTDPYNLELSKKRAESVREYLISKKINQVRFTILGFGSSIPLESNDTEEGKAMNRRVEIWFTK